MDSHETEITEWITLVGTAIMSFGDIEFVTIKCLAHLPTDTIFETTSRLPFARRVDLIVEILGGRKDESDASKTLIEKLRRAKELSEYRNVLAHNPLVADIYEHKATGDVVVERLIKAERKNGKVINLALLKEIAAEIEDIASELYIALSKSVGILDVG